MKRSRKLFLLAFLVIGNCVFAQKATSTIVSDKYDPKKDVTEFMKFPFGSVSLPGKWTRTTYNAVSGQYNFTNTDSVSVAVALNRAAQYPFYKKEMTADQFVQAMYEWDSDYLTQKINGKDTVITRDTVNHFITWRITNGEGINNHNLFGYENGVVFTVMVATEKWPDEKKVKFAETVYLNRIKGTCCE